MNLVLRGGGSPVSGSGGPHPYRGEQDSLTEGIVQYTAEAGCIWGRGFS